MERKQRGRNFLYHARIVFGIAFIAAVALAAHLYVRRLGVEKLQRELIAVHDVAVGEYAERLVLDAAPVPQEEEEPPYVDPLSLINPDYFGWLTVYGTQVDYPVVLGSDNDWYLTRDFYGNNAAAGSLFADCGVDADTDGNILIYGHHMKDGTMFGSLKSFKSADFLTNHGLIRWEHNGVGTYYEIFAMLVIPGYKDEADYFPIQDYLNEISMEETDELLSTLKARALLWRNITVNNTDRFLFLITCDYTRSNGRMLLCAKRLYEGLDH